MDVGRRAPSGRAPSRAMWAPEEELRLTKLVERLGTKAWSAVALELEGRSGKQCRERWSLPRASPRVPTRAPPGAPPGAIADASAARSAG